MNGAPILSASIRVHLRFHFLSVPPLPRGPAAAIIARVRWPLRHPFKTILLLAWAGLYVVTWAVQFGRLGVTGDPLWSYERREISTATAPDRRPIAPADVEQFTRRQDGARVYYRAASAGRHRGVLRVTASSVTYAVDDAAGGFLRYDADRGTGFYRGVADSFVAMDRLRFRFPIVAEYFSEWAENGQSPTVPPDPSFRHTFTRTNDALSQGWDLDVRLPFWLIYLALAAPLLPIGLARVTRRLRRRRRRRLGRCEQCGYDRRGLPSARCPECGHPAPAPATREDVTRTAPAGVAVQEKSPRRR